LMLACAVSALVALQLSMFGQWLLIVGWAAAYVLLIIWVAQMKCSFKV
jgi:hypothetical protein